LEADRHSCEVFNGHGNAISQVYNHIIMPLANERDKHTQIRWGKKDFKSRFKRDPEGMWLAEAAVDYATIAALISEKIRFIVLAPSQAQRCRNLPNSDENMGEWYEVGGSQIDATRPYRCFLPGGDRNRDYIDIFFYDGPISRDMGFNDDLYSAERLSGRIGQAVRGDHRSSQLISVATDGETFGHHKKGTEKTLAYAFLNEFPQRNWTVTNYAHYLSINPPTWEVELKPITAWSCAHGVDRWQDDCGCGGEGGVWHQKWRKPLRESLDWLRDQLVKVYEETGKLFFRDPWLVRDEYIQVMCDRSIANVSRFLHRHQSHKLTVLEQVDALRLLEMQRHALLMYTSCGWFFEEISRPEGTQILRYAARALELAGDVAGVQLEKAFIKRLTQAPSNVESFKHGAEIYRQLVVTAQIGFRQVAAQYAISSLFGDRTSNRSVQRIYCYTAHQVDYQVQRMGSLTLAVGQLRLVSDITWESQHLTFAVLHLGGWDFHCCIQPFTGRRTYSQLKEKVFGSLEQASAAQTILAINQVFGEQTFSLQNLFAEERHRIMELLSHETLTRLDQLYTQVYRDNYGLLMAFHRDGLDVPQELQVAAEIALKHRCVNVLKLMWEEIADIQVSLHHLGELEATATEAKHLRCNLHIPAGKQTMEQLILRSLWQLLHDTNLATLGAIQQVERLINVANQLNLGLNLGKSQELYFSQLPQIVLQCRQAAASQGDFGQLQQLLNLGQKLGIGVGNLLKQLP
jgi:alpha-amylase/alpha-mannosidase (GH57 family)